MKRVSLLFALLCVSVAGTMASEINHDDPWNPHHIDGLPADIRHYIAGICRGDARAQHDFATYNPSEKRWRINLEYLSCPGLEGYRKGNQCLDVDFIELGSHFRLARKEFRSCGF
jgi:hypothetical protein